MKQREIKFRGLSVEGNTWQEGNLVYVQDAESDKLHPYIVCSYGPDTFTWDEVEPETVGRFTGLHDRNRRGIYEGDIVRFEDLSVVCFRSGVYRVAWLECGFCAVQADEQDAIPLFQEMGEFEVIGNIHQHHELLKP